MRSERSRRIAPGPRRRLAGRLAALALLASGALQAQGFTVFACEPEWAALTRVLEPAARLHVATHAGQDPHHIEARPALIAQVRGADLLVCTGASLEAGWLPMLQDRAGNPRARDVFFAADHVELIDPQPGAIGSPWAGDVHAEGNPHLHTDPERLLEVARALAVRLGRERPGEAAAINARLAAFEARWTAQTHAWRARAAPLKGRAVAAQHTSFGYLWRWLGMTQVADLEPRPGMSPTPGHLQRLLEGLRAAPPMAIVASSYQDPRPARWLGDQLARQRGTPVPVLVLPATVPEDAGAEGLVQWMDDLLAPLLQAAAR